MTYELLLFVHITAAIVWLGGGVMMQLFAIRARNRARVGTARQTRRGRGFTPRAAETMSRLLLLARIDLVLLFAIVFLMVVKPGL